MGAKGKAPSDHLYDLSKDPAEKTDVAASHPADLKRLQDLLDKSITDGSTRKAE